MTVGVFLDLAPCGLAHTKPAHVHTPHVYNITYLWPESPSYLERDLRVCEVELPFEAVPSTRRLPWHLPLLRLFHRAFLSKRTVHSSKPLFLVNRFYFFCCRLPPIHATLGTTGAGVYRGVGGKHTQGVGLMSVGDDGDGAVLKGANKRSGGEAKSPHTHQPKSPENEQSEDERAKYEYTHRENT